MPEPVKVTILDREYLVSCEEDERAALLEAAEHLSARMREVRASGRIVGVERIAVMVALNITHELLDARRAADTGEALAGRIEALDSQVAAFMESRAPVAQLVGTRRRQE